MDVLFRAHHFSFLYFLDFFFSPFLTVIKHGLFWGRAPGAALKQQPVCDIPCWQNASLSTWKNEAVDSWDLGASCCCVPTGRESKQTVALGTPRALLSFPLEPMTLGSLVPSDAFWSSIASSPSSVADMVIMP